MRARALQTTTSLRALSCPRALLALSLTLASGCLGSSPKTTFHTLGVETLAVSTAPRAVVRVRSLGVGPVQLPALLDRPGVLLRKDAYTVELSPSHQWAGQLSDELVGALTRYLKQRLPDVRVVAVPWETAQAPEIQLTLSLDQFDGAPDGVAVLNGNWTLQDPSDGRAISEHRVTLKQKVEGDEVSDVVQAQAKLVVRLGERVLRALR